MQFYSVRDLSAYSSASICRENAVKAVKYMRSLSKKNGNYLLTDEQINEKISNFRKGL